MEYRNLIFVILVLAENHSLRLKSYKIRGTESWLACSVNGLLINSKDFCVAYVVFSHSHYCM